MSVDPIPKRIFVGNFDYETTESELLVAFQVKNSSFHCFQHLSFRSLQVCGRVADVNIIRKSFSDFYGFVTFTSPASAEDALEGMVSVDFIII